MKPKPLAGLNQRILPCMSPLPPVLGRSDVGPARPAPLTSSSLRDGDDVPRLGALSSLSTLKLDLRTLCKRLVAVAGDSAVVDEHVLATVRGGDEPVPLCVVEPLDGPSCHKNTSSP